MDFEIITDKLIKYTVDNSSIVDFLYEHINDIYELTIHENAKLAHNMFKNQIHLRKINIRGIHAIPYRCFENCKALNTIDFNNDRIEIKREAFLDCEKLDNILNDENVVVIEKDAFIGTRLLRRAKVQIGRCLIKYVYEKPRLNLTDIDVICSDCFKNNENIISLTVNPSVKLICEDAFSNCANLEFVKINSNTKIEQGAFNNTLWESVQDDLYTLHGVLYKKKDAQIETIILPNDTVEIPDSLFEADKWVQKIIFNSNIRSIGKNAFNSCTNLKSISISTTFELDVNDYAFANCINLEKVEINCNPTILGSNVFDNCIKLKSQTIDNISKTDWFRNKKGS
jgi:hypothetical protein